MGHHCIVWGKAFGFINCENMNEVRKISLNKI